MAGRGRLSSIQMLPAEAADDVLWANQELYANQRPIKDIFEEFNERLAAKGLEPISRTAFYNRSLKLAAAQRRMREAREMFSGLASEFTAEDVDENTIVLGEYLKTLIQELVDDGAGRKDTKGAQELASAYRSVVAGQKISTDRRMKLVAELETKTVQAVEKVARERGLSDDTVEEIKARILGVRA